MEGTIVIPKRVITNARYAISECKSRSNIPPRKCHQCIGFSVIQSPLLNSKGFVTGRSTNFFKPIHTIKKSLKKNNEGSRGHACAEVFKLS